MAYNHWYLVKRVLPLVFSKTCTTIGIYGDLLKHVLPLVFIKMCTIIGIY